VLLDEELFLRRLVQRRGHVVAVLRAHPKRSAFSPLTGEDG
jgi:hypothetical protein